MRYGGDRAQLRDMARLRDMLHAAAEKTAHARSRDVQQADEACHAARSRLATAVDDWQTALEGPSPDMAMIGMWGRRVVTCRDDLNSQERQRAQAYRLREHAADSWRLALHRRDLAHDLSQEAMRAAAKKAEERALSDAADRHALRRKQP